MNNAERKYHISLFILLLLFTIFFLITFNEYIAYYDEARYITLGKSLAEGHGYVEISLPDSYPHITYPIIFPFMLSLLWKILPAFPQNLILMKFFQIFLCIISIHVTYKYIVKFHNFSPLSTAGIITVSFLNYWFIFFSRLVMSDIPYYLTSILSIYFFKKYEGDKKRYFLLLTCFFIILSFGIRVVGLTLALALVFYFFIKKGWKMAFALSLFFGSFFIFYMINISILSYSYDKGNILFYYFTGYEILFDPKNIGNLINVIICNSQSAIIHFLNTIFPYISISFGPGLSLFLKALFFLFIASGLFIFGYLKDLLKNITIENLYTGIFLVLIIVVPSPLYRYIIPVLPFMCLYYFKTLRSIIDDITYRFNLAIIKKIGISLVTILMVSNVIYRINQEIRSHKISIQWLSSATAEIIKASDWLNKNSNEDDLIACRFNPIFYLYSGRKTILTYPIFAYSVYYNFTFDKCINENIDAVIEGLKKLNARFLVFDGFLVGGSEGYYSNKLILTIINRLSEKCKLVYSNNKDTLFIFKIDW